MEIDEEDEMRSGFQSVSQSETEREREKRYGV